MMDQDVVTAVRESFSLHQLEAPAEQVMRRGQRLRRRRASVAGGLIAGVAAVAITVTALGVGESTAAGQGHGRVQLTAWTLTREPHRIFKIEFKQLADLRSLNAALRADDARTIVSFGGVHPLDCQGAPGSTGRAVTEVPRSSGAIRGPILILHLKAMPAHAMAWIQILRYGYLGVSNSEHHYAKGSFASIAVTPFRATKACAHTSWAPDLGQ
jgi:hypothetical protein